jgi:two-component system, NtrC family, nitrogen regulation sensor histidine kinase NtrY
MRKRFRRRLVAVMLLAGLVPMLLWAIASWVLVDRGLGLSLEPLEEVLDRTDERLAKVDPDSPVQGELDDARLQLAKVELGRRSLRRLAPWGFAAAVAVTGALLVAAAFVLARATSGRVERLTESVAHYARGELGHRTPERPVVKDEIDVLVRQFNEMGAKLEAQQRRLATTEALAAWQQVARTLAHDLKNPLTAMRLSVARLGRSGELVDALQAEIDVLLRMTESFASFAKLPAPVMKPVELRALLEDVIAIYGEGGEVAIELAGGPRVEVRGDADQLRRALGNLIKNAVEASPAGGAPVQIAVAADGGDAVITIADHGSGVAEPIEGRRLLSTLGTTKPTGSGLGLPIAAKIVHEHAGSLRLEPVEPTGARAVLRLPLGGGEEAVA